MKRTDFTNKIINNIHILNIHKTGTRYGAIWKCLCLKCNNEIYINSKNLNRNCGKCEYCDNLLGKTFGKNSIVLKFLGSHNGNNEWLCKCGCGRKMVLNRYDIIRNQSGCKKCQGTGIFFVDSDEKRRTTKYQKLIKAVYLRDKYTCKSCNTTKGKFNCHHLDAWKSNPEKRFDENNCVTLCISCHKSFHRKYGRGSNTRAQFIEFVGREI